jgi:hypothetical protein
MTEDQLTEISDKIASGTTVAGWGGERHEDIHVLRRCEPDQLWERRVPNGKWTERLGLGPNYAHRT